jgi:uncharacterized protein (DUF3084 family)
MQHIESERSRLQQRMAELETKVQDVTDVRKQLQRHPMLLPGSVIAGSWFLAAVFWKR